jgi:hypothetical protein
MPCLVELLDRIAMMVGYAAISCVVTYLSIAFLSWWGRPKPIPQRAEGMEEWR